MVLARPSPELRYSAYWIADVPRRAVTIKTEK
jgi:hypothetical protein